MRGRGGAPKVGGFGASARRAAQASQKKRKLEQDDDEDQPQETQDQAQGDGGDLDDDDGMGDMGVTGSSFEDVAQGMSVLPSMVNQGLREQTATEQPPLLVSDCARRAILTYCAHGLTFSGCRRTWPTPRGGSHRCSTSHSPTNRSRRTRDTAGRTISVSNGQWRRFRPRSSGRVRR